MVGRLTCADRAEGRNSCRGLRTSKLLVLAVAAWPGWITHGTRQQREAVAAIHEYGGTVRYDYEYVDGIPTPDREPAAPKWLRRILGDEFFQEVVEVNFSVSVREGQLPPRSLTEKTLLALRGLGLLRWLELERR
jgi:hypothetical protein